jgi:hypothetical protein
MINMIIDGRFEAFLAESARGITTFIKPQMIADERRCRSDYLRSSVFICGSNAVDVASP